MGIVTVVSIVTIDLGAGCGLNLTVTTVTIVTGIYMSAPGTYSLGVELGAKRLPSSSGAG